MPVAAQPRARRNEIRGEQAGRLKVCVTQPAERGKANQAIIELLAEQLELRRAQITLLSGQSNSYKRFLLRGVSKPELDDRLTGLLQME